MRYIIYNKLIFTNTTRIGDVNTWVTNTGIGSQMRNSIALSAGPLKRFYAFLNANDFNDIQGNKVSIVNYNGICEIWAKNPKLTPYHASGCTIDIGYFDTDSGSEIINFGGGLSKIYIGSYHTPPFSGTGDNCIITIGKRSNTKNTLTRLCGNIETNEMRLTQMEVSDVLTWVQIGALLNVTGLLYG